MKACGVWMPIEESGSVHCARCGYNRMTHENEGAVGI